MNSDHIGGKRIPTRSQYGNELDYLRDKEKWLIARMSDMGDRLAEAEKDTARLDWLADVNNTIGNVLLPAECVTEALTLRGALDAAMSAQKTGG